jgi:hypothetical protein
MAHMNRWWDNAPNEIYWVEITDRVTLGTDLNAPQRKGDGSEFWGYSLLLEVNDGDIVFHYHKPQRALVAWSAVAGGAWEDDVVWGARGATARGSGVVPFRRPGWRVGLDRFQDLESPVTLDEMRAGAAAIARIQRELEDQHGRPLYFPFELSPRRPLRPAQGYLAKWPAALVPLFEPLSGADRQARATRATSRRPGIRRRDARTSAEIGAPYRRADEETAISGLDPYSVDPALIERAVLGHRRTQNLLADIAERHGAEARSPRPEEPNFDLAWSPDSRRIWVVEVKSTTELNEEKQLRLGLGQVLRYQQVMSGIYPGSAVVGVLAAEREPADPTWPDLCHALGVSLVWPETMESLF